MDMRLYEKVLNTRQTEIKISIKSFYCIGLHLSKKIKRKMLAKV